MLGSSSRPTRHWLVGLLACAWLALLAQPVHAQSQSARPLTCGVEGSSRLVRAVDLCTAVSHALKRTVLVVDDARKASGEAVQIIRGDVQWTVIWLADGKVHAWTRVSQTEAAREQLLFVVHATEALVSASHAERPSECVRLDPNAGHAMRSSDLRYPWAELKPCKRKHVEVVDPWWLPG